MRYSITICIGVLIGYYGAISVRISMQPPYTLIALSAVSKIAVELCADPVPAGKKYFKVQGRLHAVIENTGAYSAHGFISILLPAALVKQTYGGSISSIHACAESPFLYTFLTTGHSLPQKYEPCKFYAKGIKIIIEGRYSKSARIFFGQSVQPLFAGWSSNAARIRAFLRFYCMRLLFNLDDAGGLLLALLAADKAFLNPACIAVFKNAGLSHILALSGMHISIVATAAVQSGKLLGNKKRAIQFSLAAVCCFVWFAGGAASLSRATGMLLMTVIGQALSLRPAPLSILSTMFCVHLIVTPTDALTVGFMFSYAACAGIMLFTHACTSIFAGKIPPKMLASLAAFAAAVIASTPITIYTIGGIASAGIIASCIISPFISCFFLCGVICLPLMIVFPSCLPIVHMVLKHIYTIIFFIANFFAQFPFIAPHSTGKKILLSIIPFVCGVIIIIRAAKIQKHQQLLIQTIDMPVQHIQKQKL